MPWTVLQPARSGVAIYPYTPPANAEHQIPLQVGDHVQIREGTASPCTQLLPARRGTDGAATQRLAAPTD